MIGSQTQPSKRQMILDGAINVWELHFAGPVPDDEDDATEHEGTWSIDDTWIDPKLLDDGRNEEMEYVRKHGVVEGVDEKGCYDKGYNPLSLKWVDKMKGYVCLSRLVCRDIKRAKNKT